MNSSHEVHLEGLWTIHWDKESILGEYPKKIDVEEEYYIDFQQTCTKASWSLPTNLLLQIDLY